jgi:hypothetical protein
MPKKDFNNNHHMIFDGAVNHMGLGYEDLPKEPLSGHRRYIMGVLFPDPMQYPQLVLQEESTGRYIYGYSPQGPHSGHVQFSDDKGQLLGYMRGPLDGLNMKMGDKSTPQVFDAKNRHLGSITGGISRSPGIVDPSGKWLLALHGRSGGVLNTMSFYYAIIHIRKKKFFRKMSGKPDPEERVGYLHGSRKHAMMRISFAGLPGFKPGAWDRFKGEFTLDLDKSEELLLALALFFRENALFEFREVMPSRH